MASKMKSTPAGGIGKSGSASFVPVDSFASVLAQIEPRPDAYASRELKKGYAERLSNKSAVLIANQLRATGRFRGLIHPGPDGKGRETTVPTGAFNKTKKTDVNFSTLSGLELLVSIKTLSFRDVLPAKKTVPKKLGRYTKNMLRNDHELRAEAMEFHERYPYAVLAAVLFMPLDSCSDAETDKSSFAHAVMTFRSRAGRRMPHEPAQMFELFYIGLYEWEGPNRGQIQFFDVMDAPPKRGAPRGCVSLEAVIRRIVTVYEIRNQKSIPWDADTEIPVGATAELSFPSEDAAESEDSEDESVDADDGD